MKVINMLLGILRSILMNMISVLNALGKFLMCSLIGMITIIRGISKVGQTLQTN